MARRHRTLVLTLAALAVLAVGIAVAGDDNADPTQRSLPSGRVLQPQGQAVPLGSFPVGGAVTPDGRFAWAISIMRRTHQLRIVSVERKAAVQTLPLANATGGIAVDPHRARAHLAFSDGVRADSWNRRSGRARPAAASPPPRGPGPPLRRRPPPDGGAGPTPRRMRVERTLSVGRPEGLGTMPVDVTTSRDGAYLLVAEAGADELAAFRLPAPGPKRTPGAFGLIGRNPVAAYPGQVGTAPGSPPGWPPSPR